MAADLIAGAAVVALAIGLVWRIFHVARRDPSSWAYDRGDRMTRCRSMHNARRCQRRAGHGWFHLRFDLFGYAAWAPTERES